MATNTYVALDKVTVGTAVASVTLSSINQGYTDLIMVCNPKGAAAADLLINLNGDSASNYSFTRISGNGTTASSARGTSNTALFIGSLPGTGSEFSVNTIQFQNYSNTTTFKSVLGRTAFTSNNTSAVVGLWRNTAAITSIAISTNGGNLQTGSTFSLYGIAADSGTNTPKATGGTITYDQFWTYHTFTSSGTFTPSQSLSCDVLVVAGGGSGGNGGGGAGGLLGYTSQPFTATGYSVTIGAGGAGGTPNGAVGNASQFGALGAATGGGGGAYGNTASVGGSGGGGASGGAGGTLAGAAGTSGQGFAGGNGASGGTNSGGGGGGGAGAVGTNGSAGVGGTGGAGKNTYSTWATATSTGVAGYYAGGGGGGAGGTNSPITPGAGGAGGGGNGGNASNATAGAANTGSGGGGIYNNDPSGAGGSGLVIVRYPR